MLVVFIRGMILSWLNFDKIARFWALCFLEPWQYGTCILQRWCARQVQEGRHHLQTIAFLLAKENGYVLHSLANDTYTSPVFMPVFNGKIYGFPLGVVMYVIWILVQWCLIMHSGQHCQICKNSRRCKLPVLYLSFSRKCQIDRIFIPLFSF